METTATLPATTASLPQMTQTRGKKKAAAAGVKNPMHHNKRNKGKRYGPKVLLDQFVQPGQILFRQKCHRMHPGRNVDIGRGYTLYAKREGYVRLTQEVVEI